MPSAVRTYNALSGKEVRQLLTAEIDKQLSYDSDFGHNITYREIQWEWTLKLKAFESPARDVQFSGTIQQADPVTKRPVPAAEGEEPVLLEVTSSRSIDIKTAPDAVRRQAGLHVPHPRIVPQTGEMVDTPVEVTDAEKIKSEVRTSTVEKILAPDDQELVRRAQTELDPKVRTQIAESLHKRGIVVPAPVREQVADARSLSHDVVDKMEVSLGLSEEGAVPIEGVSGAATETVQRFNPEE